MLPRLAAQVPIKIACQLTGYEAFAVNLGSSETNAHLPINIQPVSASAASETLAGFADASVPDVP